MNAHAHDPRGGRHELPAPERHLVRWLLRGAEAEFVVGDLVESYRTDRASGMHAAAVRWRLARAVVITAAAWWRPRNAMARRAREDGVGGPPGRGSTVLRPDAAGFVFDAVLQDLRIAARSMRRRPGFTAGVALTLGLGIGATTTIFSVVDGVLLRPLPYTEAPRLAAIGATFPSREWADEGAGLQYLAGISLLNYADFRERSTSFERIAGIESTSILLPDLGDGPELALAASVSPDFFEIFDLTPSLGRTFLPEEYSTASEAAFMISYGAWQRRYGGDPAVVGRPLDRVGTEATIVGVLPRDFEAPEAFFNGTPDFWMPLMPDHDRYASRGRRSLYVAGLMRPGVLVVDAREEARDIAADLARTFPDGNVYPDGTHFGIGVNGLHAQTVGTSGGTLRIFLGAAALLLVLAAMNAATLLLARSLDRAGEFGVRRALGAGRARLVRLLLTEALLLAGLAGAIGIALAWAGVEFFVRFAPADTPRLTSVVVDARILGSAAGFSLLAGVVAGLAPALGLGAGTSARGAETGARHSETGSRVRSTLVAAQLGVAVLLLSAAGLLFSSFVNIVSVEPGFEPEGLVTMNVGVKRPGAPEGEEMWQAWDLVLAEMARLPGLTSVAGASNAPFQDPVWAPRLLLPGDDDDTVREGIAGYSITPGYFETIGTPVVAGRDIRTTDRRDGEPVALVNQEFVRTQLGGADPLGLTIVHDPDGSSRNPLRIVGVVGNVIQGRAEEGPRPAIYVPYTQVDWPFLEVVVRAAGPVEDVLSPMRQAVARFNAVVPPRDLRPMSVRMADRRITPRFQAMLIGGVALIALLIAATGLYGSLAHAVGRRRRELGVRMALGAARIGVIRMVVGQGLTIAFAGLVLGLSSALFATRVIRGLLFGVEPHDPATLVAVVVLLGLVALLASLVPAGRATSVDPVEVLRAD